ncbi:hypothetical protein QBC41DRAFT_307742 [Cercophora samala]|uniref:Uncharacterized protein n=1 Tax=Cercophora samala TaxID=330535 RepID=A0AA40D357_9PEZI|nr:hypothetical protein QBC41DRAFT_307742 [Cercophora samala]
MDPGLAEYFRLVASLVKKIDHEKAASEDDPDKVACLVGLKKVIVSSQITILHKRVTDKKKLEPIERDLKGSLDEAVKSGPRAEEEKMSKLQELASHNNKQLAAIIARDKTVKDAELALAKEKRDLAVQKAKMIEEKARLDKEKEDLDRQKRELESQEDKFVEIQASTAEYMEQARALVKSSQAIVEAADKGEGKVAMNSKLDMILKLIQTKDAGPPTVDQKSTNLMD